MLTQPKDDIVPVRVINPSPVPVTLYQNTSVDTFSKLGDGAFGSASCNRLATKKQRQTKLLASNQFDLDAMNLNSAQRKGLASLLDEFTDVFSSGPSDLGRTGIVQHRIDTGDHPPIKQAPRRIPMHQQGTVRQHMDDMLQHGVVQPSTSLWAAPIVLVKKKDGSTHFCVDYRKLNDMTRKDAYPLLRIDENLDALAGANLDNIIVYVLLRPRVQYLGHVISAEGVSSPAVASTVEVSWAQLLISGDLSRTLKRLPHLCIALLPRQQRSLSGAETATLPSEP